MFFKLFLIALFNILIVECMSYRQDNQKCLDPIEKINRDIFNFNYNILDVYIIRPAAIIWRDYIPKPARNGLNNFFSNLEEPATIVNYIAEGKFYKAMIHFNRIFLNTIFGIGGIIDIASMANLKLSKEESHRFGSMLGNYGIPYGPYIQLPGYGSFTFREDIGGLIDNLYPLLSYLNWWMSISKWMLEGIENRIYLISTDDLLRNSHDPYITIRNAYFQRHNFLAKGETLSENENLNSSILENELNLIDK